MQNNKTCEKYKEEEKHRVDDFPFFLFDRWNAEK